MREKNTDLEYVHDKVLEALWIGFSSSQRHRKLGASCGHWTAERGLAEDSGQDKDICRQSGYLGRGCDEITRWSLSNPHLNAISMRASC